MAISKARRAELVAIWVPCLRSLKAGQFRHDVGDRVWRACARSRMYNPRLHSDLSCIGFSLEGMVWSLTDAEALSNHFRRRGFKAVANAIREAWLQIVLESEV